MNEIQSINGSSEELQMHGITIQFVLEREKTMSRLISFLCILFYFTTIPATRSNNETDLQALIVFKNSIDIDPQGALSSWNETVHFCRWPGIFCGRKHPSRVLEIDLMSRGLVGTISPHLGNLSFLRSITLQNNSFHGPIPQEFGRLRRLEYIEFSNNTLSGEITRNLSNCVNIYYLNLIDNDLTGIIPPELSSLVKLQSLGLSLSNSQLSRTIPPFIGNFTSLWQLSLIDCGLQGEIPESLGQLKSLQYLDLSQNNLIGKVPSGLFNISTMLNFDLNSNQLEGTIPPQIGLSFSRLQWLSLTHNQFSGEIPLSLSNLSSLEYIALGPNNFSGQVMINFHRFSALRYFQAYDNNLEGDLSFISSMINCTRLHGLVIAGNLLSGLLPHSIANLSNDKLNVLALSNNQFHGSIPPSIGNLHNLGFLYLSSNNLVGPIPSDIGKCSKLQELDLNRNRLTQELPPLFENLTLLSVLDLSLNTISGNIPPSLSRCRNLLELNISHNNFNGGIPVEVMSTLSTLNSLDLSYNGLTGFIPPEVGSLQHLVEFHMSHNRLSGPIPNSLSRCVAMELIHLQSNSFDEEIPNEFRSLRSLQSLDLSDNNLSGAIPGFLGELNDLMYLNLSFNKLGGEVPTRGVFLNETAISFEGNSELCGGIPSLGFPPCSSPKSNKNHFPLVLKILIPVVCMVAIVSICHCIFLYKGKSKDAQSSIVPFETDHLRLSYGDLLKSTGGFSELNLLGGGRFGLVYKAVLEHQQTSAAVKVINLDVRGAAKSLMSECNALRGIRHRNLVKIVSVCSSTDFNGNDFKALVYEYMVNGDLDKWIHRNSDDETRTLNLRQRVNVAIDIASGLEYLHSGTESTTVHGDLKPSNILLDEDMIAHVSDFGLAKVISDTLSATESSSLGIRGTIGYIPPEYGMSGNVSIEGDVYSYGILLLEMFTGKRPTNDEPNDSPSLRDLVRNALRGHLMDVIDLSILHEYNHRVNDETMSCIVSVLEIGLACSNEFPRDRMLMKDVVNGLRKAFHMAQ